VINQCRTADGTIEQADGMANVVEGSQGAKLRVSFFRPFYGDYWILDLDPDYRWVLVGEPGRKYAWILAREQQLDQATLEALLARAAALGFDRRAFLFTPHTKPSP
jgi:apolipoprotein D and lipocalin family protein